MRKEKCVNSLETTTEVKITATDMEIMPFGVIQAVQSIIYLKR